MHGFSQHFIIPNIYFAQNQYVVCGVNDNIKGYSRSVVNLAPFVSSFVSVNWDGEQKSRRNNRHYKDTVTKSCLFLKIYRNNAFLFYEGVILDGKIMIKLLTKKKIQFIKKCVSCLKKNKQKQVHKF